MKKIAAKILILLVFLSSANLTSNADELSDNIISNDTEINLYGGMFDFSDQKQSAALFGLQHQNE